MYAASFQKCSPTMQGYLLLCIGIEDVEWNIELGTLSIKGNLSGLLWWVFGLRSIFDTVCVVLYRGLDY